MTRQRTLQQLAQRQRLAMSPQQVQYVRLLEMSGPEFDDEVRRQLDENPALELSDETGTPDNSEVRDSDSSMDDDEDTRYGDEPASTRRSDFYEPSAMGTGISLLDQLLGQISQLDLSPEQSSIVSFLAGNVDNNGYLMRTPRELADDYTFVTGRHIDESQILEARKTLRGLDPAGVGAADLRDCLLLQLTRQDTDDAAHTLAVEVVQDYFDVFARMDFARLRSLTGAPERRLEQAIDLIRTLNPKPGASQGMTADERLNRIVPDFIVENDGERLTVTTTDTLPELVLSESFDIADTDARDTADIAFIRRRRDEAAMFVRSVRMRRDTLMRVMQAIVRLQHDYFVSGNEAALRPMILKDVSELTGDDLSVISRATAGKYVMTAGGIKPLKFFFNENATVQEGHTQLRAMAAIRELIEAEDPHEPLSDQAIADTLNRQGYDLARRTVAKYRERAGLPVARLRRKF